VVPAGSNTVLPTGRLETEEKQSTGAKQESTPGQDRGLQSAPTGQDSGSGSRAGVHSAPPRSSLSKGRPDEPLSDFLIESDAGPTAAAVDEYLEAIFGQRVVKDLRSQGAHTEWSSRVSGLEAIQKLVKQKKAESAAKPMPTGDTTFWRDEGERLALFRGVVTVLVRALSDKVVPVYLPALSLLNDTYSSDFFAPMQSSALPKAAIAHFAHQLVFRSGSSNGRAREESSNALLHLARCEAVGCAAVAPWVTRPISNTKQAHAVVSRLELLRTLVAEFDLGSDSGLELMEVLRFTLPLCEVASGAARDAAIGLLLDVRALDVPRVEALIDDLKPSALVLIKARLATPDAKSLSGISVTGRKLPPIESQPTTPLRHDAHSRARATSSEVVELAPPAGPKKPFKAEAHSTIKAQPKLRQANCDTSASRELSFE